MRTRRHSTFAVCATLCVLALAANTASAQSSAPTAEPASPASAASAPSSTAPVGPRLRTPSETGNRAAAPGTLRPERPVTPQISIPFGKAPPPASKTDAGPARRSSTAPAVTPLGTIDDAAARCEAQADDRVRAVCRDRLAREAKGRAPG